MLTPAKKEFIEFMMSADVLRFGSFVTKSGRNTPYFVNTGNYRTGSQIAALGRFYASLVKETCGSQFDAMFGPAYKGIPLATACAASLSRDFGIDRPYFFNRKEVKDHGEGGSIVGYKPKDGDNIIIIEDVITAGTAVRRDHAHSEGLRGDKRSPYVYFRKPLRSGADSGQNRYYGGTGGIRHSGSCHRHCGGYPRISEGAEYRSGDAQGHGRLYMEQYCVFS